jgi:hypothetical protein
LGSVELQVSSLAKESGDGQSRYESTGIKKVTEPIRLDNGNIYKGSLQYTASFVPALAVKGAKFESKHSEIVAGDASDNSSSYWSSDDEAHEGVTIKRALTKKDDLKDVPQNIPILQHAPKDSPQDVPEDSPKETIKGHVASQSTDSGQSLESNDAAHTADENVAQEGVEMSPDELLTHRTSGVCSSLINSN